MSIEPTTKGILSSMESLNFCLVATNFVSSTPLQIQYAKWVLKVNTSTNRPQEDNFQFG